MEEMDKLKRQMKRFMNVGKRNVPMPDEFGGGVQTSPKELVKPIKPKKSGVLNESKEKFAKRQRKLGVEPV